MMLKFLPDSIGKFTCALPRLPARPDTLPPMLVAELMRLRGEITRLNDLVSDLTLDNGILRDVARLCARRPEGQS